MNRKSEKKQTLAVRTYNIMKSYYPTLILTVIVLLIGVANWHPNTYVMGLDTYAPFLNIHSVLDKVFGNNGSLFIEFSGLLFTLPLIAILQFIQIPAWAISQIMLFSALFTGVLGMAYLTRYSFARFTCNHRLTFLFGGILYLSSLFTYWIFNQPNLLFVAGYVCVPWGTLLLAKAWGKTMQLKSALSLFAIITTVFLFGVVSLNLVAFVVYLFITVLLASLVMLVRGEKLPFIKIFLAPFLLILGFMMLLQLIALTSKTPISVFSAVTKHIESIQQNDLTNKISDDVRASSYLRNSFLNTTRFAGNWMETHDQDNIPLFQEYSTYNQFTYVLLGLLPFILALSTLVFMNTSGSQQDNHTGRLLPLHLALVAGIFLCSNLFIPIAEKIPLIETALRWNTSKFWGLLIIPMTLLAAYMVSVIAASKQFHKNVRFLIVLLLGTITLIHINPVLAGNLFSPQLTNTIPQEYFTMATVLEQEYQEKKILYLPKPQQLYFYSYDWGYFGSDFFGYLSNGDYIKTGPLSYFHNNKLYDEVQNLLEICSTDNLNKTLVDNEIDLILYDDSITLSNSYHDCLSRLLNLESETENLSLYTTMME